MVINCNVPSFQNLSTDQKLKKMERYLYDLNDQLRVILNNLELDNFTLETREAVGLSQQTKEAIQTDFNALKQAIIKTAREISSNIETITEDMEGHFSAISDQFGQYEGDYFKEKVENALGETTFYQQVETINGIVNATSGYIRTGNITGELNTTDGNTHYGIVICSALDASGNAASGDSLKVAIESGKMSFYEHGYEVAYMSGTELVINRAKIAEYIYLGGYRIGVLNGIEFKWEGY